MLIMPSFQKSLIVEQFQGNYLKCKYAQIVRLKQTVNTQKADF